jgi:type IV secretory pathway VirB4 component
MTKREFLNTIATAEDMPTELVEFAAHELEVMNAANEKNRAKAAEKRATKDAEKEPIRNAIMDVMTNEPQTATMLIEAAGLTTDEVKPQSIPSLLKPFIEAGTLEKVDVKIPEKKGTQKGYKLS